MPEAGKRLVDRFGHEGKIIRLSICWHHDGNHAEASLAQIHKAALCRYDVARSGPLG